MKKAVFQGSFDPFTLGHLDILSRAASMFAEVHVLVANNPDKRCLFTASEREEMIALSAADAGLKNVQTASFGGLTVEYARSIGAGYLVRGLRSPSDYEYEARIESFNKRLAPEIETVYISCAAEYSYLSSSAVKELLKYGADVGALVPARIYKFISERYKGNEQ